VFQTKPFKMSNDIAISMVFTITLLILILILITLIMIYCFISQSFTNLVKSFNKLILKNFVLLENGHQITSNLEEALESTPLLRSVACQTSYQSDNQSFRTLRSPVDVKTPEEMIREDSGEDSVTRVRAQVFISDQTITTDSDDTISTITPESYVLKTSQ
jgi:hypothetical protein